MMTYHCRRGGRLKDVKEVACPVCDDVVRLSAAIIMGEKTRSLPLSPLTVSR